MNDKRFLHLSTLYLEGAINDYDLDLLNRELADSPERVRQFNDLRLLTGLINEHGYAVEPDAPANLAANGLLNKSCPDFSAAGDLKANAGARFTSRRPIAIALGLLATAASLLLVLNWHYTNSQRDENVTGIATLAYTSQSSWEGRAPVLGEALSSGRLHLEVGLARLDFRNGATITLQGPAEFEILSKNKTILRSGILTASIPESAIGFEVVTPAMDVVDLGTAFGVSVGADGETDVCVFEGKVEVSLSDSVDTPRLVREGNAVRSRPKDATISSVDYSVERYEDAWPVTSGVLQATGLMKFVSPGPEFVPGRYEDSDHILIFPERSRVLLESELEVDVTDPGQYIRVGRRGRHSVAAGQVIRSYLLQLNPIGAFPRGETGGARVIGQITFDRPILGLIGGTFHLTSTDEPLGHPLGDYGDTRRGIEPTRPNDLPDSGRDNVTLSRDRRTLSLDLSASSAVDQIRVVVSE